MNEAHEFSTTSLPLSQVNGSDLVLNLMDSEKNLINQKLGETVSNVDGVPVDVGSFSTALKIKGRATASSCSLQSSPQLGVPQQGLSPVTIPPRAIRYFCSIIRSMGQTTGFRTAGYSSYTSNANGI